jgi:hypothetical protein
VSEYPHAVSEIKHLVTTVNVVILGSSSHLSILDSSLNPLAVVELETSLVDFCEINNKFFFVQKRQVWFETAENLLRGSFFPVLVAGSGAGLNKDGSGRSSSFLDLLSISNYQNSILIGTKSGNVSYF